MDYPESEPTLRDLAQCLDKVALKDHLIISLDRRFVAFNLYIICFVVYVSIKTVFAVTVEPEYLVTCIRPATLVPNQPRIICVHFVFYITATCVMRIAAT